MPPAAAIAAEDDLWLDSHVLGDAEKGDALRLLGHRPAYRAAGRLHQLPPDDRGQVAGGFASNGAYFQLVRVCLEAVIAGHNRSSAQGCPPALLHAGVDLATLRLMGYSDISGTSAT